MQRFTLPRDFYITAKGALEALKNFEGKAQ